MKKKTLYIIHCNCLLVIVILLIVGKKAGWFGKSGNFKEVEITEVERLDVMRKFLQQEKFNLKLR